MLPLPSRPPPPPSPSPQQPTFTRYPLVVQQLEGKEELSLILGSVPERWPHHQANFVPITKYSFPGFCTRADSQDTDQQGECSISGPLAYAAWMSTKVHDCMVESWRHPIAEQGTSASSAVRLPSWDARYVLQQERLQVWWVSCQTFSCQ